MAEVISLVSGIVSLLDFGCKVISGTRSIRDSVHGTAPDIHQLELILKSIHNSHEAYRTHVLNSKRKLPGDDNTLAMLQASEELQKELSEVISKLQISNLAGFKTLESWRVSVRRLRKDKYLGTLRDRLLELDRHVSVKFDQEMQAERQASVMAEMKAIDRQKQSLGIITRTTVDLAQAEITAILQESLHDGEMLKQKSFWSVITAIGISPSKVRKEGTTDKEAEEEEMRLATRIQQLTNAVAKLEVIQKEQASSLREIEVIRSLYFKEVFRRFEKIPVADTMSNEWIFDSQRTTFTSWLESSKANDGLYYIFGRPGSGKSTLIKFVAEHTRTQDALRKWSGTSVLHRATYYFWNQGSEMQKSGMGLFQSLLYQILRKNPDLITDGMHDRVHHELWTTQELKAAYRMIAKSVEMHSKFCFFIDGLDEYEGEEEDLISMLEILADFPHVKICASSRPHQTFGKMMKGRDNRAFDIADFTQRDMANHVQTELGRSQKFQLLAEREPDCAQIVADISDWASGVWLWVYLVTSEIRKEVEKGEGIETLRSIVNNFPSDLDKFFRRIISKVHDRHKEQMAQIFLVAIEELQPLPLYAFALLEQERSKPHFEDYAVKKEIKPFKKTELEQQYEDLKLRLQNRCSYFLVVDNQPHPVCLSHSVDFFHRTVRDFLRDSYRQELDKFVKPDYNPLISLCNICLALLKGSSTRNFKDPEALKVIFGLTDELLYYAHEVERRSGAAELPLLISILDELDKTNDRLPREVAPVGTRLVFRSGDAKIENHWTHGRDLPPPQGPDVYKEGGNCNFLALAVQARLTGYVRAKLQGMAECTHRKNQPENARRNPRCLEKKGRPLLDYALRPLRTTPIAMPYHSVRDESSIDVEMIILLLEHDADPNQPVFLYEKETVWGLFLISIHQVALTDVSTSRKQSWFQACQALIQAGAQPNYDFVQVNMNVSSVLERVFSPSEVMDLCGEFAEYERNAKIQQPDQSWWPFSWM